MFLFPTCPNILKSKIHATLETFGLNGTKSFSFCLVCFIFVVILVYKHSTRSKGLSKCLYSSLSWGHYSDYSGYIFPFPTLSFGPTLAESGATSCLRLLSTRMWLVQADMSHECKNTLWISKSLVQNK